MKAILAAAAFGLSVSGALACDMHKTVKTDTMSVASVDTKISVPADQIATASIAKPAPEPAEEATEE